MLSGFEIVEKWNLLNAIATIPLATILFSSLLYLGNNFAKIFLNDFNSDLKTGVGFCFFLIFISIILFTLSVFGVMNSEILISVLAVLFPIGILSIIKHIKDIKVICKRITENNSNFSIFLILFILFLSLLIALLPTTKMDEISYHMLLPLRVINDGIILPYSIPWEASLLPQLIYQLFFTPFFLIGFPEVANIFSFFLFIYSAFLIQRLCESIFKVQIPIIFVSLIFFSGLFVVVDIITISSSSLAVFSSVLSFGTLIHVAGRNHNLNINSSISLAISLLTLVISKITMLPLVFFSWAFYCYWIFKCNTSINKVKNLIVSGLIPLAIYSHVLILTYYVYGSPFGSMFGDFFKSSYVVYDPYTQSAGQTLKVYETIFLSVTKFNPFVWIFTFICSILLIKTKYKFLIAIFTFQFFIIILFLPEKPRHFQGIQLVLASFVIAFIFTKFQKNFNLFISLGNVVTSMYAVLILYYSAPLIYYGYFTSNNYFFKKYIPYYKNFSDLNKSLPMNAKIVVTGSPRINLYHMPRPQIQPKKNQNKCLFHFLVGNNRLKGDYKIYYSDNEAVQYTFRTPNTAPKLNKLKIYHLINDCKVTPK